MPTPVCKARQCLTDEAARTLDDAVAVARRRSHAQTTSLHAVSALLALPSSALREACARARSAAYPQRLQFRAMELSVGVSLDRLPTTKAPEEPPVANSLMAAIKRSQANQRRDPDTFHLYQQIQQQSQSSLSCVKVELKHFMLSILDDPIVSRVFGDAGFSSCDIKLAILQPPTISRFARSRCPPLFLCNLTDSDQNRRFPFPALSAFEAGDENCRRIGKVLVKKKEKNPLLIGVCAKDALSSFTECVQRGKHGVLPAEIDGLNLVCVTKEISDFVAKGENRETVDLKIKSVGDLVEHCSGPGVVVNLGELKVLIEDGSSVDAVNYVVSKLTGLLETLGKKLWLMGAVGSFETYTQISSRFPSIDKNWDLHPLLITSSTPSSGGLFSRSSLMGSFVPLGGFFATPSDFKNITGSMNQSTQRGLCNEKPEQEVSVQLRAGSSTSVADQHSASFSPSKQMDDCDASKRIDAVKAKEGEAVVDAKYMGLERKFHPGVSWTRSLGEHVEGFPFLADRKESSSKGSSSNESGSSILISSLPADLRKVSTLRPTIPFLVASESGNANFQPKLLLEASRRHHTETEIPSPYPCPVRSFSLPPDQTSASSVTSVTSVTTDLRLGTSYAAAGQEIVKPKFENHKNHHLSCSGSVTAEFGQVSKNMPNHIDFHSFSSGPAMQGHVDPKDFKSLWRALTEKVGRQADAVCAVSQTIASCKSGNGRLRGSNQRGDIWISFLGYDKVAQKTLAASLAEIMFGSRERLISVDLSSEAGIGCSQSLFHNRDLDSYGVKFRGKTAVDYIAQELGRKPHSIVLLENLDKADFLSQLSLSQAIRTGKFPDSHRREIGINDVIFLTMMNSTKADKEIISGKEHVKFSEERILGAKAWQMQVLVESAAGDATGTNSMNVLVKPRKGNFKPTSANKRKLVDMNDSTELEKSLDTSKQVSMASKSCLDLNLPVDETEDSDSGNCESDSNSDNAEAWLEDFLNLVDEKVVFKPFDFDKEAQEMLKEIDQRLKKTAGSYVLLEIDEEVMVQILAASWLSDRKKGVENWIEEVLAQSFADAQQRYKLTAQSVVKLVACEGLVSEGQAPGVCLPSRITLK